VDTELVVETGHWYSGKEIRISTSKVNWISYMSWRKQTPPKSRRVHEQGTGVATTTPSTQEEPPMGEQR
jgi:hypothetical protein